MLDHNGKEGTLWLLWGWLLSLHGGWRIETCPLRNATATPPSMRAIAVDQSMAGRVKHFVYASRLVAHHRHACACLYCTTVCALPGTWSCRSPFEGVVVGRGNRRRSRGAHGGGSFGWKKGSRTGMFLQTCLQLNVWHRALQVSCPISGLVRLRVYRVVNVSYRRHAWHLLGCRKFFFLTDIAESSCRSHSGLRCKHKRVTYLRHPRWPGRFFCVCASGREYCRVSHG